MPVIVVNLQWQSVLPELLVGNKYLTCLYSCIFHIPLCDVAYCALMNGLCINKHLKEFILNINIQPFVNIYGPVSLHCTVDLIFMDPCNVVCINRNNQQDATL